MNDNLKWAKIYINEMKWSVIPIYPGEKNPHLKKGEVYQYRERFATNEELEKWFKNPHANVGIVTGKLSNLFVVDLDKSKDHYIEENALIHFGDNPQVPLVKTPSGGEHLYFTYPGHDITIDENILPAIDYRGEGGYIVAPPSVNGNGLKYSWIQDCKNFAASTVPHSFINIIINKSTLYGSAKKTCDIGVTDVTQRDIWADGTRDKNLYHVTDCLTKTKNSDDYIRQTLRAIIWSWGERDEKWIDAKIRSALNREERFERNIQAMVDEFISVTEGDFSVTQMDKELGIVTQRDMAARRKALSRRKGSTVENVAKKDGWWRRIDTDIVFIDFNEEDGLQHPLSLPWEIHDLIEICEGNIILVSGEFNAGKSTFALNTLVMNKNRMRIRYVSSEMKGGELKNRFKKFGISKDNWWPDEQTDYVALNNNLQNIIIPDALNIIDYLEFPNGDYTLGAEYMKRIHDRLTTGVAVVCNQQKEGVRLPRSGDLICEKPRFAVTLRKVKTENNDIIGIAEVIKAKNVLLGKMDGKRLKYEIRKNGSEFKTLINWGYWR